MYEIIVRHPAQRFIRSISAGEQKKLLNAIEGLSDNPRLGKEITGRLVGLRSRRINSYRIIYKIEEMKLIVLVLRIGYRGNIYSKKIDK